MGNPVENLATAAINKANEDKRTQPWKGYNLGNAGNHSIEWVKTGGNVNVLTNAFQI